MLSFYKEEQAGETVNRVSLLATCHQTSKLEALVGIADDAVAAHKRILEILSSQKEAYNSHVSFSQGVISFHRSFSRYKLDDLDL